MAQFLTWLGIALLAVASILQQELYGYQHDTWIYLALPGILMLLAMPRQQILSAKPAVYLLSSVLLLPVAVMAPSPVDIGARCALLGAVLLAACGSASLFRLGSAALIGGCLWMLFAAVTFFYEDYTARMPVLPDLLSEAIAALMRLTGTDVVVDQGELVMFSMRTKHPLAATWSLFMDPIAVCFFVGGLAMIGLAAQRRLSAMLWFTIGFFVWSLIRTTLFAAAYMHRALRTGFDDPLEHIGMLWDPVWITLLMLPLVLLACRCASLRLAATDVPVDESATGSSPTETSAPTEASTRTEPSPATGPVLRWLPAGLLYLAVLGATLALTHLPSGSRKPGRILIDEYHCKVDAVSRALWPQKKYDTTSTLRPYDKDWYGEVSGYNFASLYAVLQHYYDVGQIKSTIKDRTLDKCDVLVLKVPSTAYTDDEVQHILDFVRGGGSLLMIGEHTTVYGSGVGLNRIAREFGFEFRYDSVFGRNNVFQQKYEPPFVPHPAIQHLGPMNFAVSCSIDPGSSPGDNVVRGRAMRNLDAIYTVANFYPPADDAPEMLFGAMSQVWATETGGGRVMAFTDSTIFANFAIFEPGKLQLAMGMIEWLNHEPGGSLAVLWWLLFVGCMSGAITIMVGTKSMPPVPILLTSSTLAWLVGALLANSLNAIPKPVAKDSTYDIAIERSLSPTMRLSVAGFVPGRKPGKEGFILFERALQRLTVPKSRKKTGRAVVTFRAPLRRWSHDEYVIWDTFDKVATDTPHWLVLGNTKRDCLDSDLVVSIYPSVEPTEDEVARLTEFVAKGGKLLLLDSPGNKASTANKLLAPFGLSVDKDSSLNGKAETQAPLFSIPIPEAHSVSGGTPFVKTGGEPIATRKPHGQGEVILIGFGDRFTDTNMGVSAIELPDEATKRVYEFEYELQRTIVGKLQAE